MKEIIRQLIKDVDPAEFREIQAKINAFPTVKSSTSNNDNYFLALLIKKFRPTSILEIGTYVGKSAYSMAIACESNGLTYTIDTIDDPAMMGDSEIKIDKAYFKNFNKIKFCPL